MRHFSSIACIAFVILSSLANLNALSAADRVLRGDSDWEAEPAHAEQAADGRIRAAAQAWLATTHATHATDVTPADVLRLLEQPSVTRDARLERRERPYGDMWQATVEVTIPRRAVDAWRAERSAELFTRRLVLLSRVLLTTILVAVASFGARQWDQRTCGYARRLICSVVIPLVVTAVSTIWLVNL